MHLLRLDKISFKPSHSETDIINNHNFANLKQLLKYKKRKSLKND